MQEGPDGWSGGSVGWGGVFALALRVHGYWGERQGCFRGPGLRFCAVSTGKLLLLIMFICLFGFGGRGASERNIRRETIPRSCWEAGARPPSIGSACVPSPMLSPLYSHRRGAAALAIGRVRESSNVIVQGRQGPRWGRDAAALGSPEPGLWAPRSPRAPRRLSHHDLPEETLFILEPAFPGRRLLQQRGRSHVFGVFFVN